MELGGDFDDSLFGETKKKPRAGTLTSYNAKFCPPGWFETADPRDEEESVQVLTYTGDWAYRCQDYQTALTCYLDVLELTPDTTCFRFRSLQESVVRCHLALGQTESALNVVHKLDDESQNFEQKTNACRLLALVHHHAKNYDAEVTALQKVLLMHPHSHSQWLQLVEAYSNILHQLYSKDCVLYGDNRTTEIDKSQQSDMLIQKNDSKETTRTNRTLSTDKDLTGCGILNSKGECFHQDESHKSNVVNSHTPSKSNTKLSLSQVAKDETQRHMAYLCPELFCVSVSVSFLVQMLASSLVTSRDRSVDTGHHDSGNNLENQQSSSSQVNVSAGPVHSKKDSHIGMEINGIVRTTRTSEVGNDTFKDTCSNHQDTVSTQKDKQFGPKLHPDAAYSERKLKLMICTCLQKARLILTHLQRTASSFVKEKNEELIIQVDRKISSLAVSEKEVEACIKHLKRCTNESNKEQDTSQGGRSATSQNLEEIDNGEDEQTSQQFEKQWYLWIDRM